MKLYTRTGDDGTTGLLGGQRLGKNDLRIHCIGTVDELNAVLGLAAAACPFDDLTDQLHQLQSRLFDLGADLGCPADRPQGKTVRRLDATHINELEKMIDTACATLAPLSCFILPGGGELAGWLHLARTVCRRAERDVVALAGGANINPLAVAFLNRLSDLLFALARTANHRAGVEDVPWQAQPPHPPAKEKGEDR